jgi:hypothetical protein
LPPIDLERRHPEPGFSRVKDLARSATTLVGSPLDRIPANPRQILRGLTATQDDVN